MSVGPLSHERELSQIREAAGDVVLRVEDLSVRFPSDEGPVNAVQNLTYEARLGRTLAIVGESGSGKSVSSMTLLGLHNPKRSTITGSINLDGTELVGASEDTMRKLRSSTVAMVFQDPQSSLHPFYKVGRQIAEAFRAHHSVSRSVADKRAVEMLDRVGIPNPARRAKQYPHEFSGGMRQRAMIALGLVNDPKLLVADEPTTALDVTVQAQILDLISDLQKESGRRSSSSPTTSRWSPRSPTTSSSCMPGGPSSAVRPGTCSPCPTTRTRWDCWRASRRRPRRWTS